MQTSSSAVRLEGDLQRVFPGSGARRCPSRWDFNFLPASPRQKVVLVGSSRIDSLEAKPRLVPAPAGLHETLARLPAAARGAGRTALAAHSHLALHVSLWKRFDAGNLLCKARSHLQRVFL